MTPRHPSSWPERHRPTRLPDVALWPQDRAVFEDYISGRQVTNLLLHGRPGVGKTTTARILIHESGADALELDASIDRGIEMVRGPVLDHLRTVSLLGDVPKLVFLDEVDGDTRDAWQARRGMMERFDGAFILAANEIGRIPDWIRSRCYLVHMSTPPVEERARILRQVLEIEGVTAQGAEVGRFAASFRDLRVMLRTAEACAAAGRPLTPPDNGSVVRVGTTKGLRLRWDLKPLTAPERFTLLNGAAKIGKSTLARLYVAAKSRGDRFLEQQLTPGTVVWVATPEEHGDDVLMRLEALGATANVHVITRAVTIEEIADCADEVGADLVVLGSLGGIVGFPEESSNTEIDRWFTERAYPLIRSSGAAWLAIHQLRKGDGRDGQDIRGATAIRAQADITLILEPGGGTRRRRLRTDGNRVGEGRDLLIELDDCQYHIIDDSPTERVDSLSTLERSVIETLTDRELTRVQLQEALEETQDVKSGAVYSTLRRLEGLGLVAYRGLGKRGDPRRYHRATDRP